VSRKSKRERLLFRTHEPPFQATHWAVGQLVDDNGRLFRVTRWVELRPVHLGRGGSVGQWEVWGRPVPDEELEEEVARAAEHLLDESV
jgi:hypothetical protein